MAFCPPILCRPRRVNYLYLLVIISTVLLIIQRKIKLNTDETKPLFLVRKEYSYIRYFQQKEQQIKESSFRIRIPYTRQVLHNKTSFLIYEYTRHRQFCKKEARFIYSRNCPFKNCQFTCDSSLNHTADALLMVNHKKLDHEKLTSLFNYRNPDQIWMFWYDEPYSPSSIYNQFLFNWTITYRLDSEVSVSAYGITLIRDQPMTQFEFNQWTDDNYRKRLNEAAWFVSNCGSKARLAYYHQLKNYFPIFAAGKCIVDQENHSSNCTRSSNCELEKLSTLKFYLAFESVSTKSDYISEKFWRALSHGTIPVVLGPKRQDYERVAPPYSFVYVKDFSSPQALAQHLHDITTDRNQYEKYHRWRIDYETRYLAEDVEPIRFCELCYKLNTNRDRIWYTNINKYFSETYDTSV